MFIFSFIRLSKTNKRGRCYNLRRSRIFFINIRIKIILIGWRSSDKPNREYEKYIKSEILLAIFSRLSRRKSRTYFPRSSCAENKYANVCKSVYKYVLKSVILKRISRVNLRDLNRELFRDLSVSESSILKQTRIGIDSKYAVLYNSWWVNYIIIFFS